ARGGAPDRVARRFPSSMRWRRRWGNVAHDAPMEIALRPVCVLERGDAMNGSAPRIAVFLAAVVAILAWTARALAQVPPPPPNDDFSTPTPIPAIPFTTTEDTTNATSGPRDPTFCVGGATVWFTFTPSTDESILTGEAPSALTPRARSRTCAASPARSPRGRPPPPCRAAPAPAPTAA